MYCYVGIEALAVSALYELYLKNETTSIPLKTLTDYGVAVVRYLNEETETPAILLLDRRRTRHFLYEYSDLFEVNDFDSPDAVLSLKKGVEPRDVLLKFIGSFPMPVLKAMRQESVLSSIHKEAA